MTRVRTLAVTAVTAAALTLTGCGVPERIVHLQDAPTVEHTGAPLREDAAQRIATRVLGEVAGAENAEERSSVVEGPAQRILNARDAADAATSAVVDVVVPDAPTVLAMSEGEEWPRAILAATLDESTQVQSVHVLVSTDPASPFRLYATAPMFAGTSVPSLGSLDDGVTFETSTADEPIDASELFTEYGSGITFPRAAETTDVDVDDPYAQSLRTNAQVQVDALDELGAVAQTHALVKDSVVSFSTATGGISFGQMVRRDRIAINDRAKELQIGDETLQELSGKEVVTSHFEVESLENFLMVWSTDTAARIIGAEEIVLRASGE